MCSVLKVSSSSDHFSIELSRCGLTFFLRKASVGQRAVDIAGSRL